jgi:hypothetical protein
MKNEILNHIYSPIQAGDWMLVKTNKGIYSLRLGGYRMEKEQVLVSAYEELYLPFKGFRIEKVYSDDYWMFILLENNSVISCGDVDISLAGEIKRGVEFEHVDNFDVGFFASEYLHQLVTGSDGWSKKDI